MCRSASRRIAAELRGELLKLQGAITDADMARMNNEVETQGQEPKAVADAFLAENPTGPQAQKVRAVLDRAEP